jgi:exopolysaccharide biosynthesis polyprenyl glycosylphosphotransferase
MSCRSAASRLKAEGLFSLQLQTACLPWRSPRKILFTCFGLDLAGVLAIAGLINGHLAVNALQPPLLMLGVGVFYGLFSWLFGGYTVLRWPWLRLRLVLQRLVLSAVATAISLILIGWALDLSGDQVALLNRTLLFVFLLVQGLYAFGLRLFLRRLASMGSQPTWRLLAAPEHHRQVVREWERNPFVRVPSFLATAPSMILEREWDQDHTLSSDTMVVTYQSLDTALTHQLAQLKSRGITVATIEELAQAQLERLPPSFLPMDWLNYSELNWASELSFQRKLKRVFDVVVSILLLFLTAPLLITSACLIWLEDRGPVFYVQERSGWLGKPFRLFKLRTMHATAPGSPTPWTAHRDGRVTGVGSWLRRTRLDELPQLWNVLIGDMSLIGPRPEQPNLDLKLEESIPHYAKRYWMLPGLSGWAQVCGPAYPASLEEAELKLSYDLYYLRNWSIWLDLLIFVKTIKTVLKVRGV